MLEIIIAKILTLIYNPRMIEHEQGLARVAEAKSEKRPSLVNTALLTGAWYVGTDIVTGVLEKYTHIQMGTGMSERELAESFGNPRHYLTHSVIAAPAGEEIVFRKIPQIVLRSKADSPLYAIATSAIFAGLHNVKTDGKIGFETKKIPLLVFSDGLLFWYLSKKRGIAHAMVAHATTNALVFAQNYLNEKMRKKK